MTWKDEKAPRFSPSYVGFIPPSVDLLFVNEREQKIFIFLFSIPQQIPHQEPLSSHPRRFLERVQAVKITPPASKGAHILTSSLTLQALDGERTLLLREKKENGRTSF